MEKDSAGKSSVRLPGPGVSMAGQHRTDRTQNVPPGSQQQNGSVPSERRAKSDQSHPQHDPQEPEHRQSGGSDENLHPRARNQAWAADKRAKALSMNTSMVDLAGPGGVSLTVRNR